MTRRSQYRDKRRFPYVGDCSRLRQGSGGRVVAVLLAMTMGVFCLVSYVKAEESFADLKARYLKLRNTDSEVSKESEWEDVAADLVSYGENTRAHGETAAAMYNAAQAYQQLARAHESSSFAKRALRALEHVGDCCADTVFADDALLERGDIELYDLEDEDDAADLYQEFLLAFPKSPLVSIVKARLKSIDDGSYEDAGSRERIWEENDIFVEPKITPPKKKRDLLIVLDPGHGGEDFGAMGVSSMLEKDMTLQIALVLKRLLVENLGAEVKLTRRRDVFVPLAERTNFANDFDADLFISLHNNASPEKKLSGLETYYLDNSGDEASAKLAERENASFGINAAADDLGFMLSDLIQNAKMGDSIQLARVLQRSTLAGLRAARYKISDHGVKKAPFYVLVGAHMPCVLIEMFFIDNALDGKNLALPHFRLQLAQGIFQGIKEFVNAPNFKPRRRR